MLSRFRHQASSAFKSTVLSAILIAGAGVSAVGAASANTIAPSSGPATNYAVRYRLDADGSPFETIGGTVRVKRSIIRELAATPADLLILEGQTQINPGADLNHTPADIRAIRVRKTLLAYTSLGSIDGARDRAGDYCRLGLNIATEQCPSGQPLAGEMYVRYWLKSNGQYVIYPLLLRWMQDLRAQGFEGAFIDVVDPYGNCKSFERHAQDLGVTLPNGCLSSIEAKAPVVYEATKSIIELVAQLNAEMDRRGGNFRIALGHNPYLIANHYWPGDTVNRGVTRSLPAFKSAIDFAMVESLDIPALDTPNSPSREIANILGLPGFTEKGFGKLYAFGRAQVLSMNYYASAAQYARVFPNDSAVTWTALSNNLRAFRAGMLPYATPNDASREGFQATYSLLNRATAAPDLLVGSAFGGVLNGQKGSDLLVAGLGSDTMFGGENPDRFLFSGPMRGADRVTFKVAEDKILVSAAGFGGGLIENGAVTLRSGRNPQAVGSGGEFLYDPATGWLRFDRNGATAGGGFNVALIANRPALTPAHFIVVK